MGMQDGITPMKENLAIFNKIGMYYHLPSNHTSGIYPEDIHATASKYISKKLFTEELFVIVKYYKLPICSSI